MPPGAYQAEPPEATSAQFWLGPGAGTFFSSAANLKALAAAIIAMLGGHVSTEAAMAASWPSLSGEIARLAHTPHLGWLATAGAMVAEAGMAIDATAASFETSKFATPHPGEVAANQSEHVALNSANFLGFLTPLIIANRVDYGRMWMQGVTNKYAYEAGSVPLQAVPPVPPPPPSTVGGAGSGTPGLDQAAAEAGGAPMDSFFQQMTGMLPAIGQMPMSLMQSVGSGGPLKSLTQVPEQLLGQMGSLASAANLSPEAGLGGLASPDWVTATPLAGGAVNASLAGGGAGGFGGAGTVSAASALRSPGSWASAVSAAPATGESTSRFSEVRPQATTVPASSGGGMGGAMAPLAHGAAAAGAQNNDDKKEQTQPGQVLVSAADLFRSSEAMPVITGGGGLTRASEPGGKEAPV